MSNDVEIRVTGTNLSGPALKSAKDGTDALGASAKKAADDLNKEGNQATALERKLIELKLAAKTLGDELKRTGDQDVLKKFNKADSIARDFERASKKIGNDFAEDVGKGVDKAEQKTKKYARSIAELSAMAKSLGEEFARTGDIDVLKNFKEVTRSKKELENFGKSFGKILDGSGQEIPNKLKSLIEEGFSSAGELPLVGSLFANPAVASAAGGIAVAIAPAILTAVGGAVQTAAAGGFLAAGLVIAAKDPQVATALGGLKRDISDGLAGATAPFRDEIVKTTGVFESSFASSLPGLKATFAALAPEVTPLAAALAQMAEKALPGIEEAARGAAPILHELAQDAPELGKAIGDFFHDVAGSGPGAATVFHALLVSVESLLEGLGVAIKQASLLFDITLHPQNIGKDLAAMDDLHESASGVGAALGANAVAADQFSSSLDGSTAATSAFGDTAMDAGQAMARFNTEFGAAVSNALDLNDQLAANTLNLIELGKSFKDNGATIDENSEKGARNVEVIDNIVRGYEKARESAIEMGGGTEEAYAKANKTYNDQIGKLQSLLVKLGIGKQAAADFLNQFYNKDVTIAVHVRVTETGPVSVQGVVSTGVPLRGAYAHGGVVGGYRAAAAAGGPRGGRVLVGEDGPEIADLPPGTNMHTAGDSARMMAAGNTTTITLLVMAGDDSAYTHALVTGIRDHVQVLGGDGSVLGVSHI